MGPRILKKPSSKSPNSTTSSSATSSPSPSPSPATKPAVVAHPTHTSVSPDSHKLQIHRVLLEAAMQKKHKEMMFKLEQEFEVFLQKPGSERLDFSPMSSYQRLIIHKVADYFRLQHTTVEHEGKQLVVVFRAPGSRIPSPRLSDIVKKELTKKKEETKKFSIMKRKENFKPKIKQKGHHRHSSKQKQTKETKPKPPVESTRDQKLLEAKEAEYQLIRASIFKN